MDFMKGDLEKIYFEYDLKKGWYKDVYKRFF